MRRCPIVSLLATTLLGVGYGCGTDQSNKGGNVMAIQLTSTAFGNGEPIPRDYTGEGADKSPPLKWSDRPKGTKSFALICDDPDAPGRSKPWVHWVIYNLQENASELNEGIPRDKEPSRGVRQGKNDFSSDNIGYRGPMPPPGKPHRYFFKLYALDTTLELPAGVTKEQLESAMKGHILGEGQLMGTYER
jgi:Raf kinase inhibitor-like YbhB/YbcL family protein